MRKLLAISGTAALIASLLVLATVAPAGAARRHHHHRGHHHGGGGHPTVTLSESDNGKAVSLHPGQRLQVILHSTYWTFDAGTDTSVLARQGDTQFHPGTLGKGGCPPFPGSGCGTAVQTYVADSPGTSTVTASRTTCGEALLCSPDQSTWSVDVTVIGFIPPQPL
ncbi:MAG: hypothetical protein JOZ37_14980 [Actinobacteria bacterium]|nr:hypothetical protein [Actinomycetota bacterium]MBV9254030.1 hypothetical protein [Actinomycetota bacterium]MBV9665269.1 hypothetical protein [Actinomycetota bacterium]